MAISFILLVVLLIGMAYFQPFLDKNTYTGKYILHYSWKGKRKYIQL